MSEILQKLAQSYRKETRPLTKIIDAYLAFLVATGILQVVYVIVARTTFPFNAFLAGFIANVGAFVFAVNLRLSAEEERAFADFVICNLVLYGFVVNFIG